MTLAIALCIALIMMLVFAHYLFSQARVLRRQRRMLRNLTGSLPLARESQERLWKETLEKFKKPWEIWSDTVHYRADQLERMEQSLVQPMVLLDKVDERDPGLFTVAEGQLYTVSYSACSCQDFKIRQLPCRHMYFTAKETGYIQPYTYLLEEVEPNPERGYMNLAKYSVTGAIDRLNNTGTRTVYARDEQTAAEIARKNFGFSDPITVQADPYVHHNPSKYRQAVNQGAFVPPGTVVEDLDAATQRAQSKAKRINRAVWEKAADLNIPLSLLAGTSYAQEKFQEHNVPYPESKAV